MILVPPFGAVTVSWGPVPVAACLFCGWCWIPHAPLHSKFPYSVCSVADQWLGKQQPPCSQTQSSGMFSIFRTSSRLTILPTRSTVRPDPHQGLATAICLSLHTGLPMPTVNHSIWPCLPLQEIQQASSSNRLSRPDFRVKFAFAHFLIIPQLQSIVLTTVPRLRIPYLHLWPNHAPSSTFNRHTRAKSPPPSLHTHKTFFTALGDAVGLALPFL